MKKGWTPPTAPTANLAPSTDNVSMTGSNARQPVGRDVLAGFVNASAKNTAPLKQPKGENLRKDPGVFPTAKRSPTTVGSPAGARYGIRVNLPGPVAHEAGATQANGKIISGHGVHGPFQQM